MAGAGAAAVWDPMSPALDGFAAELRERLLAIEQKLDGLAATAARQANILQPSLPGSCCAEPGPSIAVLPQFDSGNSGGRQRPEGGRSNDTWSETPQHAGKEDGPHELPVIPDSSPGDGSAAFWAKAKPKIGFDNILAKSSRVGERFANRLGMTRILSAIQQEWQDLTERDPTSGWRFVHGFRFQLFVSVVILLHSFLTGYSADTNFKMEALGRQPSTWTEYMEMAFCGFFAAELGVRLYAERLLFFVGCEWRWNAFDSALVSMSMADLFLTRLSGHSDVGSISVGRVFRLARFFRLMRISRVMRQLQSLRMILFAILDSMVSLLWCLVFIGFIVYTFAVLIVYGVAEYFRTSSSQMGPELSAELIEKWGGIYRSMISLFMAITGGADWGDLVSPLTKISDVYEMVFIAYIFFMCLGVLNVVVGAFVATTQQIADEDRELLIKSELGRFRKYADRIKVFFKAADTDRSGKLSWSEFQAYLQDPQVKAYFQILELDVSQAHVLFDLLDTDDSDQVTVDEFLNGCMRLKGQARSVDLNMLSFLCERGFAKMGDFMHSTDRRLATIDDKLGGTAGCSADEANRQLSKSALSG